MVVKQLNETIKKMYLDGLLDENFVMEAVSNTLGGYVTKSTKKEDMYDHIDFWWNSPKQGKIGIDVKGIRKNSRHDADVDDTINWIEILNVSGNPGWIYGKATYIAFRTKKNILFVKNTKLQTYANEKTKGKPIVNYNPNEFYVPYQRKGRKDIIFKVPTTDIENLSDFTIEI